MLWVNFFHYWYYFLSINTKLPMLYIQIMTANTVAILNVGLLGLVIAITLLAIHEESLQLTFVGILCAGLTIGMYASPLSSMVSFLTHYTCHLLLFYFLKKKKIVCWKCLQLSDMVRFPRINLMKIKSINFLNILWNKFVCGKELIFYDSIDTEIYFLFSIYDRGQW